VSEDVHSGIARGRPPRAPGLGAKMVFLGALNRKK